MKQVHFLHSADIHFDRDHQNQALASLERLLRFGRENPLDLWVIAGDLFHRAVQNTESSGFPRLLRILRAMTDIAPLVAVRGTPTHDLPGSYDALEQIHGRYPFIRLEPLPGGYLLYDDGRVSPAAGTGASSGSGMSAGTGAEADPGMSAGASAEAGAGTGGARLLILGCPEQAVTVAAEEGGASRESAYRAAVEEMERRFTVWAETRRRHRSLPCLMVYHGLVRGAVLQNGGTVPAGELAVSREALARVEADYYALGHIHLAQRVGRLPAWYAGSAFPVDWGERDPKTFYYVTLRKGGKRFVQRVQAVRYPHPPRCKIVLPFGTRPEEVPADHQVWLEVLAPRDEVVHVDRQQLLEELHALGALPGSRISVTVLPAEAVRASRIQAAQRLEDKLRIWAESSGEALTDLHLARARSLEAEARAEGLTAEGRHIRIRRLVLRGAIGIRKGLGREEIELNLDRYAPGLIALIGPNGSGKTTLIENMHPFPEMLTRGGKLQDHFYLRDSFRDLYFNDEREGAEYRALIRIDGQSALGKVEYLLYRNGRLLTNGRREDYQARVTELFGSLSLFLRSVFVSQRPNRSHPDLSDATKGEKKALFRELAGLDYLQQISEAARRKARELEEMLVVEQGRAELLAEALAALPEKRWSLQARGEDLLAEESGLGELEEEEARLREKLAGLQEKARESREKRSRLEELDGQVQALVREKAELQQQVEALQAARGGDREGDGVSLIEARLRELDELRELERRLIERKAALLEERERRLAVTADLRHREALLGQERRDLLDQIRAAEQELRQEAECPRCRHLFIPELPLTRRRLQRCRERLAALRELPDGELSRAADFEDGAGEIDRRLEEVRGRLDGPRPEDLRAALERSAREEVRIAEAQRRILQLDRRILALQERARGLADGQGERWEDLQARGEEELESARQRVAASRQAIARLEQDLRHLAREIGGLEEQEERQRQLLRDIRLHQQEAAEWRLLERACGPDGIQALELDAMGPGIAEVANRLLQAAYGTRFQIEFRTTRTGGQGSRRRQIEDFQIWVFDSEGGTEQVLETLSGGETVWVRRAISDAFAIIRDRTTGQRFLTAFQDEADGALDPAARLAYFQMLEAAHREGGRLHTLVITHSQEAQEMIAQRITFHPL